MATAFPREVCSTCLCQCSGLQEGLSCHCLTSQTDDDAREPSLERDLLDSQAFTHALLFLSVSSAYADMQHSNHRQRTRQQAIACELPDISEETELPATPGQHSMPLPFPFVCIS